MPPEKLNLAQLINWLNTEPELETSGDYHVLVLCAPHCVIRS